MSDETVINYCTAFFAGENIDSDINLPERLEYLHVIVLPNKAFAVNKAISELNLANRKVLIKALRREGEEIDMAQGDTILHANDILVLQGKPRRAEYVEHYLLDGIE